MNIAIIGGGAAGFFAAISAADHHPNARIVIYEKSKKLLSKVKISGGGRCNVTNGTPFVSDLCKGYPRGGKKLKKAFRVFNNIHAMQWFESRGVPLVTQEDQHVFPVSQDSQSIIDCFLKECRKKSIEIKVSQGIRKIEPTGGKIRLHFIKDTQSPSVFDKVIVATGGSPSRRGLEWLEDLGHKIENPVPSLFTFNMPNEPIKELMGIVVKNALTSIQGSKLKASGPLLITHWGMSGPAILVLSAFGARILSDCDYTFNVLVNWVHEPNQENVKQVLQEIISEHPEKNLSNFRPYLLPERLWHFLLEKCSLPHQKKWSELGKKGVNKITNILANDIYTVRGKTTFKEEFVTCGGVSLQSINMNTMESTVCPNLYFAGEVMDIDAITGGYNFQAAWTTGYIAGKVM